jgi:hypothetical protein
MSGFYGRFIERFSVITEPLHELKHKNARLLWGKARQTAFEQLKDALSTPHLPDFSREFTLVCDTSEVLRQKKGEDWLQSPIAAVCCLPSIHEK